MLDSEQGFVCICTKESGSEYRAPRADYARLLAAWKRGDAFLEFVATSGNACVLKGASVESLSDMSAENLESLRENKRADRAANAREI